MNTLEGLTTEFVEKYIAKFNNDEKSSLSDNAIENLINSFPENKNREDIFLKVSVINTLYSTNIFDLVSITNHIYNQDIDSALKAGDLTLVDRIAVGHNIRTSKNDTELTLYSFATKYCSWHNQNKFPIFDGYIEKILMGYKKKDAFSNFSSLEIRNYIRFHDVIQDFRTYYKLTDFSVKDIDKFLWVYGKEVYPNTY